MSIDFKGTPFHLKDEDIRWVEETLSGMTLEEKIGHLFCILIKDKPVEEIISECDALGLKPGSYMTDVFPAVKVKDNFKKLQACTEIPLLFASNLERGADGICTEGTMFGTQMQAAAGYDTKWAYELGRVCASEASVLGANWNFGPVCDIDTNFHNPITNTRAFSSDPELVLRMAKAFARGQREYNVATCLKHWPGDGRDERDQHMVSSINDCSVEEWEETYGRIYRSLIVDGAETIMSAHILLPAYAKEIRPEITQEELLPATLSYELTHTLLREKLGFNGLVVTDATTMTGFMQAMSRKEALPRTINSGCDVILFTLDMEEDFEYIKAAVREGVIRRERLDEAVLRILALKARLGLHRKKREGKLFPEASQLKVFEEDTNRRLAKELADQSVTLVKDTQKLLPISPKKHRRVLLHVLGDKGGYHDPVKDTAVYFKELLVKEGFEITDFDAARADLRPIGNSVKSMTDRFDLIIYYCSVKTSGSDNVSRITWAGPGGCNTPRYIHDIPTVFLSVDNPYMLLDAPVVKTYINGYTPSKYVIDAMVEKLMGRSEFKGVSPVDPFCGLWNAKF